MNNNNNDAIIFGIYIPNNDKIFIFEYYLDIFVTHFLDCDFFFGINPSNANSKITELIKN